MRPSAAPRPRSTALLQVVAALLLCAPLSSASQRVVQSGWLEPAAPPFEGCNYVLRSGPGEKVQIALADPQRRIFGDVPGYQRLTVELTTTWFSQSTGDVPKMIVLHVHPPATMAFKGLACGADPGRFAACDNGLYPSLDEPLPRNLLGTSSGGTTAPDRDGDGVPDSQDAFPDDPNESRDTDGDGVGNNADPDDDNDLMPDSYELENGLNPLVDDADSDLDGDRQANIQEAVAGTRANDSTSYFRIETLAFARQGTIALAWFARPGRRYSIFHSPDLESKTLLLEGITVKEPGLIEHSFPEERKRAFYFVQAEWLTAP